VGEGVGFEDSEKVSANVLEHDDGDKGDDWEDERFGSQTY